MAVTRRTFSATLASAVAVPRLAFSQAKDNCAFYSGVGGQLTHYEVDFGAATLAKRAAVTLPGGIQYAWPHPSRRYLYVATSSGGVGIAPIPGYPANQHYLAAFHVTPLGELAQHGEWIKLRQRPVHASVDHAGEHLLVAYNFPSNVSVHKIKGDGSIGDEVKQADELEKGIYFHQIRATPADKTVLIVARGNNPEGNKPEDPGSLHVYDFKNGVLTHRRKIAPSGGYGFGGRHLDIHPTQPWVYLSVERQNQLIVYKMAPDGDLAPEPLFTKSTLADPAQKFRVQAAGPIHIHPNGRFVYLGNRSGLASAAGPGVEDVGGKMVFSAGESDIAVFAIDQQTGEPTPIQHADIRAAHPRTFGLDTGARLLVAGSLAPSARREEGKVVELPAGLTVFRMGEDGKLTFARKYDIDVGAFTQWWTGMIPLA
ncbi:MAG TPA: beta-propeller fold lactonase family protein [Xanthobacteraceae bacterium]